MPKHTEETYVFGGALSQAGMLSAHASVCSRAMSVGVGFAKCDGVVRLCIRGPPAVQETPLFVLSCVSSPLNPVVDSHGDL
jgi:hypothetical protein